jgi:ribosomal protein S18 acetylase RimI-like enzyme
MTEPMVQIRPVRTADDLAATIALFHAYAASLDVDLAYQDFDGEIAAMPGKYAPPHGALLLARDTEARALGCVALRPLDIPGCCEMKRLYVSPVARGGGVGGRLIHELVETARQIGYREMRLDTLPSMTTAQKLYRELGFEAMEAYCDTPVPGTLFMRRWIGRAADPRS